MCFMKYADNLGNIQVKGRGGGGGVIRLCGAKRYFAILAKLGKNYKKRLFGQQL